jgi:hypothetical protein
MTPTDPVERFIDLSAALTGFRRVDLLGTGKARVYYDEIVAIVGERIVSRLMAVGASVIERHGAAGVEDELRRRILDDELLGPLSRNVMVMWYLGQWDQLPAEWRDRHGASALDEDRVISAAAYTEGLVWKAIGAHPQGAKPQGFGAWSFPPPDLAAADG